MINKINPQIDEPSTLKSSLSIDLWLKIFSYTPEDVQSLFYISKSITNTFRKDPKYRNSIFGLINYNFKLSIDKNVSNELQLLVSKFSLFEFFEKLIGLEALNRLPSVNCITEPKLRASSNKTYIINVRNKNPMLWGVFDAKTRFIELHGCSVNDPTTTISYFIYQNYFSRYWGLVQHINIGSNVETQNFPPDSIFKITTCVKTTEYQDYFTRFRFADDKGIEPFAKSNITNGKEIHFRLIKAPKL